MYKQNVINSYVNILCNKYNVLVWWSENKNINLPFTCIIVALPKSNPINSKLFNYNIFFFIKREIYNLYNNILTIIKYDK